MGWQIGVINFEFLKGREKKNLNRKTCLSLTRKEEKNNLFMEDKFIVFIWSLHEKYTKSTKKGNN